MLLVLQRKPADWWVTLKNNFFFPLENEDLSLGLKAQGSEARMTGTGQGPGQSFEATSKSFASQMMEDKWHRHTRPWTPVRPRWQCSCGLHSTAFLRRALTEVHSQGHGDTVFPPIPGDPTARHRPRTHTAKAGAQGLCTGKLDRCHHALKAHAISFLPRSMHIFASLENTKLNFNTLTFWGPAFQLHL
jgi:hypothetical protein